MGLQKLDICGYSEVKPLESLWKILLITWIGEVRFLCATNEIIILLFNFVLLHFSYAVMIFSGLECGLQIRRGLIT